MLEAAQLGNVATRLLFENERVKVWEMRLGPGESSDLHRHALDYLLYILEGTSIDADRPDGESSRFSVVAVALIERWPRRELEARALPDGYVGGGLGAL